MKPHRQVVNEFVEPLLAEALKYKGEKPVGHEKDVDEGMSLLARLGEYRWCV